ncbi:MAG: hypothetical protein JNJ57_02620, partial [Saprospiraceae bacterium]|nr:hypothetical protein [Saprospiraceae bacterium]
MFGQDICSSITCANLSVEIIRQEDNVSAGCPPMGASCGNSFQQLTYKVYLRAKKTIPPGQQPLPFKLEYSELAVAVKLKNNQTPQLSYIDVAATQSCYQMGAGADWYNFPSLDGDKVIFEPTENRVAISFGNLTGSATCGYEAPNGSSNQITMNFMPAPNWAEPCGGGGLQCAYAELFTVVVNAFPGEAVGFEFDTQMLMYDPSTAPGGVCDPINQVMTGQRNGLVNLVVGLPATFTGTANENVIAGFSNVIQQINYTDQPLKLTNFGNAPMTVSYVEFKVSALMQNAGLEYIGVTPRVYDGVGGSKTLHYMIPLNVTIPSGQSVDICTIRVVASQGNLNNMPWSAEFSYLETATKSRISTAGVCTRLNATALPASVNHPGDPACTDPSVHFTVDAVAATCTEFWVRVGLRTTDPIGANIRLSRMSFELAFDWTDAGIQFTGVNYSDWPVMNCGATGCFTGPPQSCYSYNPNGKIFKFCYATDDNSAPTYSLDP